MESYGFPSEMDVEFEAFYGIKWITEVVNVRDYILKRSPWQPFMDELRKEFPFTV